VATDVDEIGVAVNRPDREPRTVLVTGGAGFVGANLALSLARRQPSWEIVALDNLRRRGSELNLGRLRDGGVSFVHGDVRNTDDLAAITEIDAIVECSAEPSVRAGTDGRPEYVVHTNLLGAFNCLELARRTGAQVVFLSTSRVYPVRKLNEIEYIEDETRFRLSPEQTIIGASDFGVSERFPLDGARTLYGATKLSVELLIAEYREAFGLSAVVDRCGIIAGPWQMGRVDQGVFTYWVLGHMFERALTYFGYGGTGKQVRDLLHVDDLAELIADQLSRPAYWDGLTVNVGGGADFSLSLVEATSICRELTGTKVAVTPSPVSTPGDVPIYISDCRSLFRHTDWRPRRAPRMILEDIYLWATEHRAAVESALGGTPARVAPRGLG
jgi:CDP-paratose 2-epimerase